VEVNRGHVGLSRGLNVIARVSFPQWGKNDWKRGTGCREDKR